MPEKPKKKRIRSLTITVQRGGIMVCKFRQNGRLVSQASYRSRNDRLDIETGNGPAYLWLAGRDDA